MSSFILGGGGNQIQNQIKNQIQNGKNVNPLTRGCDSPRPPQTAFRAREALLPYLYTGLRRSYETGLGLVRSMYYEFPEEDAAYWQVVW